MSYMCKSDVHAWTNRNDADKCCNGFTRQLRIFRKLPKSMRSMAGLGMCGCLYEAGFQRKRQCPVCLKVYTPVLKSKNDRCIQDEFPDAPAWQREQLLSGICSDECWKSVFGSEEEQGE